MRSEDGVKLAAFDRGNGSAVIIWYYCCTTALLYTASWNVRSQGMYTVDASLLKVVRSSK
jgi:hypothetical protein